MPDNNFKMELLIFRESMLKAGVSPKYVKRSVLELQDHYKDIKAGLLSKGVPAAEAEILAKQQLGDLQDIAQNAISQKELHSFISTHPKLFFIATPLLCYILSALFCIALLIFNAKVFQLTNLPEGTQVPTLAVLVFKILDIFYTFIVPLLMVIIFVWLASTRHISKLLLSWSIVIISALGSLVMVTVNGEFVGEGRVSVSFGVLGIESLLRMGLTLAIALAFSWYFGQKEKTSGSAI